MAVKLYDEALINKLNKWIKDDKMVILKPNEVSRLFQIRADQNDDKPLTLPLIAVSRESNINIDVTAKRVLSYDGLKIQGAQNKSISLNAIPMTLNYQIDIYTKKYDEGDAYLRNFVFNFVNHPKMIIEIPYNGTYIEHVCNLELQPNIQDNSDISEHLFADEFTRWTLSIKVNDAWFFSVPVQDNAKIVGAIVEIEDNTEDGSHEKTFVDTVEFTEDVD